MFAKFAFRSILVLCSLLLLSTLALSPAVTAQDSTQLGIFTSPPPGPQEAVQTAPVPGGPGFISVSALAFKPYDETMSMALDFTKLYNNGQNVGYYIAPVSLPHGAHLTRMVFYYFDYVEQEDMMMIFGSIEMFYGGTATIAMASSSGPIGFGYKEYLISDTIVDNQMNSYTMQINIPGGYSTALSLIGVRIDYDYPAYLPVTNR